MIVTWTKTHLSLLFIITSVHWLQGQVFDELIHIAWTQNLQIKSKAFQIDKAQHAIQEAQSLYGPNVSFGTQYTLAGGGRDIEFPIGDLLNPVYSTLNAVTQSDDFPLVENQNINFFPNNFYDARFRIQQPIYQPDLAVNKELKTYEFANQELEILIFKRRLAKDVMLGYLNLKKAETSNAIYESAEKLLQKARETTKSLVENGIQLPEELYRIDSEISQIQSNQTAAQNQYRNAYQYLSFLMGSEDIEPVIQRIELPETPVLQLSAGQREELQQLDNAIKMSSLAEYQQDLFHRPRIGAQLDLGSQDFDFKWNPYLLLGITMEINIFDNRLHKHKKAQSELQRMSLESEKQFVAQQLQVQQAISRNDLETAVKQVGFFDQQIKAAHILFQNRLKRQVEGQANALDIIDAQTQVTQSELARAIAKYEAWSKWVEYNYATAALQIN